LDGRITGAPIFCWVRRCNVLRDWLGPDEAADLAAQLPVLVRGIYFEGWVPTHTPVHPRTTGAFLERVAPAFHDAPLADPEAAVSAVFALLRGRLSTQEIDHVMGAMRPPLREMSP
jgi:uncharacterized protein (DUF2267 family)